MKHLLEVGNFGGMRIVPASKSALVVQIATIILPLFLPTGLICTHEVFIYSLPSY